MEAPTCPACQGERLAKYGKTPAGAQKYKCLAPGCLRQFVAGSSHLLDPEIKKTVLRLLAEKVKPSTIKKAVPGISLGWIYKLKRQGK